MQQTLKKWNSSLAFLNARVTSNMLIKKYYIILLGFLLMNQYAIAQLPMPDTVCIGSTAIYRVNDPSVPSTYSWKINATLQTVNTNQISITWNTAGIFNLSVQEQSLGGCDGNIVSGTVYVKPLPIANAGSDAVVCAGKSIQLHGSGGAFYEWSPGDFLSGTSVQNPLVTLPTTGLKTYTLSVTDAYGCRSLKPDTVNVTVMPIARIFAGADTLIAANQPLQLNAIDLDNLGVINYVWSPPTGLNNPFIQKPLATINRDITYIVTGTTAAGCEAKDDIKIKVFLAADIFVPNAFTPNNDGLNDVARPILVGIKELKYFIVYNRYGQEVYRTSIPGLGWNGKLKDKDQNIGTYVWAAEAVDYKGNVISKKGLLILIR